MGFLSNLFSCLCLNRTSSSVEKFRRDKRRRYADSPSPPRTSMGPPTDSPIGPALSTPEPLSIPLLTSSASVFSRPGSSKPASRTPSLSFTEEGDFVLRGSSSRSGQKAGRRSFAREERQHVYTLNRSNSLPSSSVPPAPPSVLDSRFIGGGHVYPPYYNHPGGYVYPPYYNHPPYHDDDEVV